MFLLFNWLCLNTYPRDIKQLIIQLNVTLFDYLHLSCRYTMIVIAHCTLWKSQRSPDIFRLL